MFNPIIQGWINYYGKFYKSEMYSAPGQKYRGSFKGKSVLNGGLTRQKGSNR
ncbi:group II intron maturase-specific domain-containing protein [Clostridium sp. 1xD42-85]|uniref:group II intron maturase-specific domain-containing protein n=1 Tax=Clostridium sp. 1xD42-85 TaxID=2320084 RepID=UPI0025703ABE|nr:MULTISPECIES: group II intron maturase-specific domain-containing protein [Clostridia]